MDISNLHVVTMISNPVRFKSRYGLYEKFKKHMEDAGVNFWTIEVALGDRPFEVTKNGDPRNVQLRTNSILWHKENALNQLVERLPVDWRYVAWVDADVQFPVWSGPSAWFVETVHALQHYRVVQLFQNAVDLGPNGEALQTHQGFAYAHVHGHQYREPYRGNHMHPGYAWAMRRDAWDNTGGLIDWGVLGAGDNGMAHAWIGKADLSVHKDISGPYLNKLLAYQARCEHFIKRNIGYVPGTILHGWHGRKKDRRYHDRWKIILENKFDPDMDLKRDWQGLLALTDLGDARSNKLRDDISRYFAMRSEDSIDV